MENIEKLKEIENNGGKTGAGDDTLEIADVLLIAAEYLNDPTNKEKSDAFEELKKKTAVATFLPLRKKSMVVNKILIDMQNMDHEIYDFGSMVEIALTFDGLFAYTNINQNISSVVKDFDFYDILWASGYCDYILDYCGQDYQRISAMIDRLIAYQNIGELFEALDNVKYDKIEDLTKTINRFRLNIDPQMIHDMATIVSGQDQMVKDIGEIIDTAAVSAAKIIDKE